jgi:hypothetical protein
VPFQGKKHLVWKVLNFGTTLTFGFHNAHNGALAQADVLGIFGREGLDLATLWGPPEIDDQETFAFLMYRNYNSMGGAFGETSIQASSADQEKLAIYGAQRASDSALTLMVGSWLNLTDGFTIQPLHHPYPLLLSVQWRGGGRICL